MLSFSEQLYIRLHYDPEEEALVNLTTGSSELIAAGGLLVNLMLDNRVRLDDTGLTILDPRPTQDNLLDEALARVAAIGSIDREDPEWFSRIVDRLPLGARLFNQLMEKIIIYRHEKKGLLGLSKKVLYPFHNTGIRDAIFETERAAMLHAANPDKKTAAIIFMASCWGAPRPWKLTRQENSLYDKRWKAVFGEYWGWYDRNEHVEPIKGITADLRYAIADLSISWATVHMSYIASDADLL
jgi:hypothetical protein